ncbi:S26 family signal peptidase [Thermogymnomonas acidicola]|uniref:S26 family signal peptidase n=1 Tax=Thermogymnomonas acidicola TaxID=399579 RepID=A0AA37F8S4_9ARCH|nr:S26 family signal peptidase [Thermogymnomonas acidicola]GGM67852.1 S26 family signal peptidase [Thermogymnomonas acidicola]
MAMSRWYRSSAFIAVVVIVAVIGGTTAYCGIWPPVSVVESGSMQHGSYWMPGVINTGDMVFVKRTPDPYSSVVTYVVGREEGIRTYGEYGDVILYRAPSGEVIIHRAMFLLEWHNGTPYVVGYHGQSWLVVTDNYVLIKDVGYSHRNFYFPLAPVRNETGFITMGDHNFAVSPVYNATLDAYDAADQSPPPAGFGFPPVKASDVVGIAFGQIPWFGLIKLNLMRLQGDWPYYNEVPKGSYRDLGISLAAIVVALVFPYRGVARRVRKGH